MDTNTNKDSAQGPFGVDADYFSRLQEKIGRGVEGYEEIRGIAPELSSIPKYNPFSAPDGYFDELALRIQLALPSHTEAPAFAWWKLVFSFRFLVPVLGTLLLAFIMIRSIEPQDIPVVALEMTEDEQLQQIDESLLVEALADESQPAGMGEEDGIVNYLMENNVEEQNLDTEL
jgi:hypothetical protein